MLIMITGGSGSGKSALAEAAADKLGRGAKLYIATMIAHGREAEERVEKHRRQRAGKGFTTAECPTHVERLKITKETCILLECMSNLVANEMYDSTGVRQGITDHVVKGIARLADQAENLIIVTNEVFSGYEAYPETKGYLQIMGDVNQKLAKKADIVVEVVYGIPIVHKGKWNM